MTTEVGRCVGCGDELAVERVELGYTYCLKDSCQAKHRRGLTITTVGTNKGADTVIVADTDEVRRRAEAGELARKDTGLGLDYGTLRAGRAGERRTGDTQPPDTPRGATRRDATPRGAAQRGATQRGDTQPGAPRRAARPWTPQQEKLVRLYHDMGLDPRGIAERARQNNPRLGITERLAVQILSAPPAR